MSFVVHVQLDGRDLLPLEVEPSWSIGDVKQAITRLRDISFDNMRVIFTGHELCNDQLIQDVDLGHFSVLHVVQCCTNGTPTTKQRLLSPDYQTGYYVYCRDRCHRVVPAKLRVRCKVCKQGSLTVSTEPSCWEDVLTPGLILGHCQSNSCQGSQAEFYFKCANHSSSESAVVLYLVKSNTQCVQCITCADIRSPVLVFPCHDRHTICLDCFKLYCSSRLNERGFILDPDIGFTLGCPAGCDNSLIREVHHFRMLGDEQYERYKNFGAEECLLHSGGLFCPAPGCGAGLFPEGDGRRVVCEPSQGCGLVFCRVCLQAFHPGDCHTTSSSADATNKKTIDLQQAERARWDSQSRETIVKTTKPCPNCKIPVEKNGGCMHMVCSRCRYQWCWSCSVEWNRDCQGNHWFG